MKFHPTLGHMSVTLFVQPPVGSPIAVEAKGNETVGAVKERVAAALVLHAEGFDLLHGGCVLGVEVAVAEVGLTEGDELAVKVCRSAEARGALKEMGLEPTMDDFVSQVLYGCACEEERAGKLQLMIDSDEGFATTLADGKYPLVEAAAAGSLSCISLLHACKAGLEARDRYDNSPLAAAVQFHHAEAVKLLLNLGADINASGVSGRTAFMDAAIAGSLEMLRLLKHHNADIRAKDAFGRSASAHAKGQAVIKLLRGWERGK